MNELYNSCDIICLPSYREGLPLSLLEASLCEKAIVTTDVAGCNFLIKNNENGLVVPPRSPEELSKALESLINDDQYRKRLAQNARKITLDRYTCDSINAQILGFYQGSRKDH